VPIILLLDNGSLRADATKQLRKLAQNLSIKSGRTVYPVSLQHACNIPVADLDDQPAQVLVPFMLHHLSQGERHFILLPLFFGKSRALTSFIPDEIDSLQASFGDFSFDIADVLYPLPKGESLLGDIVYENILAVSKQYKYPLKNIVLVDHGSPVPRVTAVREHIATYLKSEFSLSDLQLEQAVMERREGSEYDFNGALLEDCLIKKAESGEKTAIVSLLFFLAGRHAGEGGDIVQICEKVMQKHPNFRVIISPLVAEHGALLEILCTRLQAVAPILK